MFQYGHRSGYQGSVGTGNYSIKKMKRPQELYEKLDETHVRDIKMLEKPRS